MLYAYSHTSYYTLPVIALSAIPLGNIWTESLSPPLLTVTMACYLPVSSFSLCTQNLNFFCSFYLHEHLVLISTGCV